MAQLLEAWTSHFQKLAQSQVQRNQPLEILHKHMTTFLSESFQEEETFLDVPLPEEEEVSHLLQKLKKSAGQEHLRYGGLTIVTWLTEFYYRTGADSSGSEIGYHHTSIKEW